jgi:SAM-dependent methyltransferase
MLISSVCRYEDFASDWYGSWARELKLHDGAAATGQLFQRKDWEWCAIARALEERGMLVAGKSGCGFAVGTEPLACAFAARGVHILATDQPMAPGESAWAANNEHAASLDALYHPTLIDQAVFQECVRFRPVDMRSLNTPWEQTFDFIWSSCSLEHLGTLEAGMSYVLEAMRLLKPGGIAVHTTEYNVSSNQETIEEGGNVIYRQQDLERLAGRLRRIACGLSRLDLYAGDGGPDMDFDYPPYFTHGRHHIKLLLGDYVATSILLIIRKGDAENQPT